MSGPQRSGGGSATVTFAAIGVAAVGLGGLWVAVRAGTPAPGDGPVPANPISLVLQLVTGQRTWPGGRATVVAAGFGVLALLAFAVGFWVLLSRMSGGSRIDSKARWSCSIRQMGLHPTEADAQQARSQQCWIFDVDSPEALQQCRGLQQPCTALCAVQDPCC